MADIYIVKERLKFALLMIGVGVVLGGLATWHFHGQIELDTDRNRFLLAALITGALLIGWFGLFIFYLSAQRIFNPTNRFPDRLASQPWWIVKVLLILGVIGTGAFFIAKYGDSAESEFELIRLGHLQSLEERIQLQPAMLEKKNADGLTLLQFAYVENDPHAVSLLIENGASIEGLDPFGHDPIIASLENLPMLGTLLDCGLNPDLPDAEGLPAVHYAVLMDSVEPLQVLLNAGTKVNGRDPLSRTPLMRAVEVDALPMIEILVEQGASVNAFDQRGDTALHLAVRRRNSETIRLLLKHDADPRIFNFSHYTALHLAALAGQTDLVGIFLEQPGLAELRDEADRTPLDLALQARKYETATFLIDSGADINRQFLNGSTWLQNTILAKDYSTARFLIRAGAVADIPDKTGRTALSIIRSKQLSGLEDLINAQTNVVSEITE